MSILTREKLKSLVVVIHKEHELNEVLDLLKIEAIPDLSNFPMIIYTGRNNSIELSEIEEDKLCGLFAEKLDTRTVLNFHDLKN